MATKEDLKIWVIEALTAFGGSAHHITVAKHIWDNHQSELNESGDLFYEWQYQMRWAADKLRADPGSC